MTWPILQILMQNSTDYVNLLQTRRKQKLKPKRQVDHVFAAWQQYSCIECFRRMCISHLHGRGVCLFACTICLSHCPHYAVCVLICFSFFASSVCVPSVFHSSVTLFQCFIFVLWSSCLPISCYLDLYLTFLCFIWLLYFYCILNWPLPTVLPLLAHCYL